MVEFDIRVNNFGSLFQLSEELVREYSAESVSDLLGRQLSLVVRPLIEQIKADLEEQTMPEEG